MAPKEIQAALYNWAEEDDENRSVLCILSEKSNETEERYDFAVNQTINGKMGQLTEALVDAMKDDKRLAKLISKAFIQYSIEHTSPRSYRSNY